MLVAFTCQAQTYCYDTNGDGETDINDVMCLVNHILGVPNPGEGLDIGDFSIVGTWYVYESDVEGLDGIWVFNSDGTGFIEEFYHGNSEGVDRITYDFSGTILTIYIVCGKDDSSEFDITIVSENEFTWTDGHDTLTFIRQEGNYYPTLRLSTTTINLAVGKQEIVNIISGFGIYTVISSDQTVATATLENNTIKVTAIGDGQTTITVTDTQSGQTAIIQVTVVYENPCPDYNHPHLIDLGLPSGTKWACCNVGADKPEAYGGYYAWGETEEKSMYDWSTYIHCDGSKTTCHDIGRDIAGTQYDVAHVKWGDSWVMPSKEQQQELLNNCSYTWKR